MSLSRRPAAACAMPAHIDASQASSMAWSAGSISPTPTDSAESPCQPSRIAPQSMEITSPTRSTCSSLGMPCTTCSFTDVQMLAG